MLHLPEIDVRPLAPSGLESLIGPERTTAFEATAALARAHLDGRRVLNVNSTATGGGVAELLQTLLAYSRGVGVDARWTVIQGNARFFEITKRIHNHLYGSHGDGGPLGHAERFDYETTLRENADGLRALFGPDDYVLLHDPQTAGLIPVVRQIGAKVVWRCHVGIDTQNEASTEAWEFLRPSLEAADAYVFSRAQFAPAWIPRDRLFVIPPSIDPFSAKNEPIEPDDVTGILTYVGLLAGERREQSHRCTHRDGTKGYVRQPVDMVTGSAPPPDVPVVLQASRWDAIKDMQGVMRGFAAHLVGATDAHLILAGPESGGVTDDPEANAVLEDCLSIWHGLPAAARDRIHLVCVPMGDPDAAAAIVNALQRHAEVVAQKSLAEGFGLTVAEAMYKSRPVVGAAVGGIADQIVPGETGALISDPSDLDAFAASVGALLKDPAGARRMGANGRARVVEHYLGDTHLERWAELFMSLDEP
jgi:trehalose synthase